MSVKTHQEEIMIYCDPSSSVSKKTVAFAATVSKHVRPVDYFKIPLTPTLMKGLLKQLDLRPKDLMNRAHPFYQDNIAGRDFDTVGWLNILIRNPQILKGPIAVRGQRAILCDNPTNILQL